MLLLGQLLGQVTSPLPACTSLRASRRPGETPQVVLNPGDLPSPSPLSHGNTSLWALYLSFLKPAINMFHTLQNTTQRRHGGGRAH